MQGARNVSIQKLQHPPHQDLSRCIQTPSPKLHLNTLPGCLRRVIARRKSILDTPNPRRSFLAHHHRRNAPSPPPSFTRLLAPLGVRLHALGNPTQDIPKHPPSVALANESMCEYFKHKVLQRISQHSSQPPRSSITSHFLIFSQMRANHFELTASRTPAMNITPLSKQIKVYT
jgi:hypothetical protein